MIISHKYKFIFVHIPKCAGTSITRSLIPYLDKTDVILGCLPEYEAANINNKLNNNIEKHSSAIHIKSLIDKTVWNDYFKFTFVRNPWDRMVSYYHWAINTDWYDEMGMINLAKKTVDFEEYLLSPNRFGKNCMEYLVDENRVSAMDFIGKYETLEEDFAKVLKVLDIPTGSLEWHNASNHSDYRNYYNPLLIDLIDEWFEWDIAEFKYIF